MILTIFAIHDLKAGFFTPPFFFPTVAQAVRAVKDAASDPNTTLHRHPGDFALYSLGLWDDQTAQFVNNMEHIALVTTLLPEQNT